MDEVVQRKREVFLEKAGEKIRQILDKRLHYSKMRSFRVLTVPRKALLAEIRGAIASVAQETREIL